MLLITRLTLMRNCSGGVPPARRLALSQRCLSSSEHQGDGPVFSNFIVQALTGEPVTIYGDGRQTRFSCYVDDTVDGLLRLMDARPS
jgi:UDP-glucuronate decarboxylase